MSKDPSTAISPQGEPDLASVAGTAVERAYEHVTALAISFDLRPGERLNEVAIARSLGVSRTPLREALNRLTAEGFLVFLPNRGFYRRELDVKEIFDLYELRQQIESGAVRWAVKRATTESLNELHHYVDSSAAEVPGRTVHDLVGLDEGFHEALMELTGNREMLRVLKNVNARIRFVRWIDMEGRRGVTQSEHRAILDAIEARDLASATQLIEQHVTRRLDQVIESVKEGYARIYVRPEMPGAASARDSVAA